MLAKKILIYLLILLGICFLGLQFQEMEYEAMGVRSLSMVLLVIIYIVKSKPFSIRFFAFLNVFALADIFNFLTWNLVLQSSDDIDYWFYIINSLYILSYCLLISKIVVQWQLSLVIKELRYQILLLMVLDVFFVYMITSTSSSTLPLLQFSVEFIYNAVIMILLTIALINYMYRDDNKSMNLLLAAIFIVFSEVIQLAYFYVTHIQLLNVSYSLFFVFAFVFIYLQSFMQYREKIDYLGENVSA